MKLHFLIKQGTISVYRLALFVVTGCSSHRGYPSGRYYASWAFIATWLWALFIGDFGIDDGQCAFAGLLHFRIAYSVSLFAFLEAGTCPPSSSSIYSIRILFVSATMFPIDF